MGVIVIRITNKVGIPTLRRSANTISFFSSAVQFHSNNLTPTGLEQTAHLQSQHPEVAQTVSWDEVGVTWIQSQEPDDQAQLNAWAQSTMVVETSHHSTKDIFHAIEKQHWVESPLKQSQLLSSWLHLSI